MTRARIFVNGELFATHHFPGLTKEGFLAFAEALVEQKHRNNTVLQFEDSFYPMVEEAVSTGALISSISPQSLILKAKIAERTQAYEEECLCGVSMPCSSVTGSNPTCECGRAYRLYCIGNVFVYLRSGGHPKPAPLGKTLGRVENAIAFSVNRELTKEANTRLMILCDRAKISLTEPLGLSNMRKLVMHAGFHTSVAVLGKGRRVVYDRLLAILSEDLYALIIWKHKHSLIGTAEKRFTALCMETGADSPLTDVMDKKLAVSMLKAEGAWTDALESMATSDLYRKLSSVLKGDRFFAYLTTNVTQEETCDRITLHGDTGEVLAVKNVSAGDFGNTGIKIGQQLVDIAAWYHQHKEESHPQEYYSLYDEFDRAHEVHPDDIIDCYDS